MEFGDVVGREQLLEQLLDWIVHAIRDRRPCCRDCSPPDVEQSLP